MVDLIRTTRALPNVGQRAEVHSADITTDIDGNGSATVSFDRQFRNGDVFVLVTGSDAGNYYVSASGATQATVNVAGGTASSTVTANVLVVGTE